MTEDQKNKIFNLLDKNEFGVVATYSLDKNKPPESAVVAISHTLELNIVFGSFKQTRKNNNLKNNSSISVVIGWNNELKQTIQLEGNVKLIINKQERETLGKKHCLKNKDSEKYHTDLRQEYFKIIPNWIRYSDFSKDPQEVWEVVI